MKTILLSISLFFLIPTYSQIVQLKATIFAISNSTPADTILADGNACVFGAPYSNAVDNDDVRKSNNIGDNFGIKRNGITLVIEGRQPIVSKDTIFYNVWNTQLIKYMFKFVPSNFNIPGLVITFEDSLVPANNVQLSTTDTSRVFITFTSSGSQAQTRFRITFKVTAILPINFSSFSASPQNGKVDLQWKVEGEKDISRYDVDYSQDGRSFIKLSSIEAKGNKGLSTGYNYLHENPSKGNGYYRIKSIDKSGKIIYSSIVKVDLNDEVSNVQVYPNPVKDQQLGLKFYNKPESIYSVRLLNPFGQVLQIRSIKHPGGSGQYFIAIDNNLSNGIYSLEIISADKNREMKRVLIYR